MDRRSFLKSLGVVSFAGFLPGFDDVLASPAQPDGIADFDPTKQYGRAALLSDAPCQAVREMMLKDAATVVPRRYMHLVRLIEKPLGPAGGGWCDEEYASIAWKYSPKHAA